MLTRGQTNLTFKGCIVAAKPIARSFPEIVFVVVIHIHHCLLYTSDAADEEDSVDLGGRRIIKHPEDISWGVNFKKWSRDPGHAPFRVD